MWPRDMRTPTGNKFLPGRGEWPHVANSDQRNVTIGKEQGSGHMVSGPVHVATCQVQAVWSCINANGQSDQ